MKLSTKGKYGVRAVYEIARHAGKGPITIKEIADRQGISLSYLEQILHKLGKAGLIESVRGPGRRLPAGAEAGGTHDRRHRAHPRRTDCLVPLP